MDRARDRKDDKEMRKIKYKEVTIEPTGRNVNEAVKQALIISMQLDCPVHFTFNSIPMIVDAQPTITKAHQAYIIGWEDIHAEDN
jgi:hypothetical protein